jgi:hypothetical protein
MSLYPQSNIVETTECYQWFAVINSTYPIPVKTKFGMEVNAYMQFNSEVSNAAYSEIRELRRARRNAAARFTLLMNSTIGIPEYTYAISSIGIRCALQNRLRHFSHREEFR